MPVLPLSALLDLPPLTFAIAESVRTPIFIFFYSIPFKKIIIKKCIYKFNNKWFSKTITVPALSLAEQ